MSPLEYQKARESGELVAWVAHRPYLPQAKVDLTTSSSTATAAAGGTAVAVEASVQRVAVEIMWELLHHKHTDPATRPIAAGVNGALAVERVAGGITNTLFHVSGFHELLNMDIKKKKEQQLIPDEILLRVFGAAGMIDRDDENAAYAALSHAGIAPPYYGRFANGRVEGWMPGMRPLQVPELAQPDISKQIATAVAELHTNFDVPPELTVSKEPNLFAQLDDWLEQAERATNLATVTEKEQWTSLQLHEKVRPELEWLKQQVQALRLQDDSETDLPAICFCHNDLLAANVLFRDHQNDSTQKKTIQLIDFEYGGINYRAFDIANHFNEYAGGPPDDAVPDYTRLPAPGQQEDFVRRYLETAAQAKANNNSNNNKQNGTNMDDVAAAPAARVSDAQVAAFCHQVQIFMLANHLYWGLWAVNQAATEGCQEYDYMLYAVNRIRQYWISKQEQQDRQKEHCNGTTPAAENGK